ncbi:NADPH-dependent FMN reductase [Oceanobacillus rekensis]|uniref:NADPH-dependent FMN reductase n=1 Tax=Oceanobacillus rekensis TaxID=937927 RepID=UPI000B435E53|nr:NADPH-dependent FMN reductase [Oceanobacillus rekensis]
MSDIVIISGSPSISSRSERVLHYLGSILEKEHLPVTHISVKDVNAEDLMFGNFNSLDVKRIAKIIENASGVIVGTPVYKAAYSGVLKALFDILPQDILQDKPVLPLMTGGSSSHMLALEYSLKPLLASLKGQNLKGLYFLDEHIDKTAENPIRDEETLIRTKKQLFYFIEKAENKVKIL